MESLTRGSGEEEFVEVVNCQESDSWESSVRLSLVGREVEELGMFLEEKEGRKRKWQEGGAGGKVTRKEEGEEREQRRLPPKKIMAAIGDMGGSGASSSSSSNMSPGWQVNDLDIDLPPELSMNEALLSLPSLAVFKQEAPSPPGGAHSPPRRGWPPHTLQPPRHEHRPMQNMSVDGADRDAMDCQQSPTHNMQLVAQHGGMSENMQCTMGPGTLMPLNGYHSPTHQHDNKNGAGAGLLMCSPVNSLDGFIHSPPRVDTQYRDDTRFQYVLAAATSIATKTNEETLTYLNQGQPYEIKLKKLGDLSNFKGKILKSVIKICFHERRLQYMEREQIAQWHAERPGERIVEVDVPLSYGLIKVQHPTCLNALHVYWDPFKDVGVYIKVNCISTEFTAKKHGGEKGVPFRIQVETYMANDDNTRLHAAAAQIKVFKLKGADRKHKQDREKVMRRPRSDLEKYQPGCDATILTPLPNEALLPQSMVSSPSYSPELCVAPKSLGSPPMINKPVLSQPALMPPSHQMKPLYCQDGSEMKDNTPACHSPATILPDMPQAVQPDEEKGLSKESSSAETQAWLARHRFHHHTNTFANFSGADLLRLSRDDIIQICGLADGIRLFNALHAKRIEPRLTIYVCPVGQNIYSALYLHACRASELLQKLKPIANPPAGKDFNTVLVVGPAGTRVRLTDELLRHLPDHAAFSLDVGAAPDTLTLTPND